MEDIEKMIIEHGGDTLEDTLLAYRMFKYENYLEYKDGELIAFISYFPIQEFDMIISIAKDNKYTRSQWRVLSKLIDNRDKPIKIVSDPSNTALIKAVERHGGYWEDEVINFD